MVSVDMESASKEEVEASLKFLNISSTLDIAQILEELEMRYRVVPGHGNWKIKTSVWNWAGFFTEGLETRWQRFASEHFLNDP